MSARLKNSARAIRRVAVVILGCIILGWLVGQIMTDRFVWSQWLFWIPTPVAVLAAATQFLLSLVPSRSASARRIWSWSSVALVVLLLISGWFVFFEQMIIYSDSRVENGVSIALWNVGVPLRGRTDEFAAELIACGADISIVNSVGGAPNAPEVRQWLNGAQPLRVWPSAVLTRLPILECREVVRSEGMLAAILRIDTTEQIGRPLTILIIDLPSEPKLSRMKIARRMHAYLRDVEIPPIDVIAGDLNMTRGGAALRTIMPDFTNAYDGGGHEYAATYPRAVPMFHIDHVLVSPAMSCPRYDVIRPALGRHSIVKAWVRPRKESDGAAGRYDPPP